MVSTCYRKAHCLVKGFAFFIGNSHASIYCPDSLQFQHFYQNGIQFFTEAFRGKRRVEINRQFSIPLIRLSFHVPVRVGESDYLTFFLAYQTRVKRRYVSHSLRELRFSRKLTFKRNRRFYVSAINFQYCHAVVRSGKTNHHTVPPEAKPCFQTGFLKHEDIGKCTSRLRGCKRTKTNAVN